MTRDMRTRMDLENCTRQEREEFDQLKKEQSQFLSSYGQEIETIKIRVAEKAMQEETKQRPELIQSKKVAKQRENGQRNQPADLECRELSHSVCDSFFAFKGNTQLRN